MCPVRLAHRQPVAIRLQPPVEHELRLALLARDQCDDVLVQAGRNGVGFDVRDETVPVLLTDQGFEGLVAGVAGHDAFVTTRATRAPGGSTAQWCCRAPGLRDARE